MVVDRNGGSIDQTKGVEAVTTRLRYELVFAKVAFQHYGLSSSWPPKGT